MSRAPLRRHPGAAGTNQRLECLEARLDDHGLVERRRHRLLRLQAVAGDAQHGLLFRQDPSLLVVSHACSRAVNRQPYADLQTLGWRVRIVTAAELIQGALDLHTLHALSFYDALIVQAAAVSGCARLLSEDMQHGAVIAGVRIENPFRD